MKLTPLEKQLRDALRKSEEHHDYCGWGDSWERECAQESKLKETITAALEAADAKEKQKP